MERILSLCYNDLTLQLKTCLLYLSIDAGMKLPNAMQAVKFHRGKDDPVHELCGPGINLALSRPETNYITHALKPGDVIGMLAQRPIRM